MARRLVDAGTRIHRAANATLEIVHPENPGLKGLSYTMFVDKTETGELTGATILPPGRIDRSPCGTGNSARMAAMQARGEASVGDEFTARSIIGSRFQVAIDHAGKVADRDAVAPRISGRGWIHGIHQIGVDPADPYPHGYMVSDCWGDAFDLLN